VNCSNILNALFRLKDVEQTLEKLKVVVKKAEDTGKSVDNWPKLSKRSYTSFGFDNLK
jgi:hypothetical protein